NSRSADIRADLYALGCTLYYLLTGRAPFVGESLTQVLLQHQMEQAQPLEKLRADVPPGVAAVVRKLMAKRPEDRFQTPVELADALEALAQGKTIDQCGPISPKSALQQPTSATSATSAYVPAREEAAVDPFWNTIVEGSESPPESAADGTDRTEAGSRPLKS